MNLSRSMRLADNDDYCMIIMFTDIVMEEEKPHPTPQTQKSFFFLFSKKRVSLESNKAGENLHILQRFSAQLRKHIN